MPSSQSVEVTLTATFTTNVTGVGPFTYQWRRNGTILGEETEDTLSITNNSDTFELSVSELRDTWYKTSFLLDQKQTANGLAQDRFENYKNQPLHL